MASFNFHDLDSLGQHRMDTGFLDRANAEFLRRVEAEDSILREAKERHERAKIFAECAANEKKIMKHNEISLILVGVAVVFILLIFLVKNRKSGSGNTPIQVRQQPKKPEQPLETIQIQVHSPSAASAQTELPPSYASVQSTSPFRMATSNSSAKSGFGSSSNEKSRF